MTPQACAHGFPAVCTSSVLRFHLSQVASELRQSVFPLCLRTRMSWLCWPSVMSTKVMWSHCRKSKLARKKLKKGTFYSTSQTLHCKVNKKLKTCFCSLLSIWHMSGVRVLACWGKSEAVTLKHVFFFYAKKCLTVWTDNSVRAETSQASNFFLFFLRGEES